MKSASIKNIWSLNVDEALVANKLKKTFNKENYEVFFPVNAQSKGIDLIFFNKNTKKAVTIQVKGSKPYDPPKYENTRHGEGGNSAGFSIPKIPLGERVDFFILVASRTKLLFKRKAKPFMGGYYMSEDYLVIPINDFREIMKQMKVFEPRLGNWLHLFFYSNDESEKAEVQCHEFEKSGIDLSKYLNNWDFIEKKING